MNHFRARQVCQGQLDLQDCLAILVSKVFPERWDQKENAGQKDQEARKVIVEKWECLASLEYPVCP